MRILSKSLKLSSRVKKTMPAKVVAWNLRRTSDEMNNTIRNGLTSAFVYFRGVKFSEPVCSGKTNNYSMLIQHPRPPLIDHYHLEDILYIRFAKGASQMYSRLTCAGSIGAVLCPEFVPSGNAASDPFTLSEALNLYASSDFLMVSQYTT